MDHSWRSTIVSQIISWENPAKALMPYKRFPRKHCNIFHPWVVNFTTVSRSHILVAFINSFLGVPIGGERPSDPQLPVRWGLLPFSWGPVPVHSDVHVSVLSAFAIDASQGYIREKRRCARLSGLGQILPFLVPCISPNSGFLGLKAPVCSSRTGEETPRSLGKVRQSPPFFLWSRMSIMLWWCLIEMA